jgi:hypothetical protein
MNPKLTEVVARFAGRIQTILFRGRENDGTAFVRLHGSGEDPRFPEFDKHIPTTSAFPFAVYNPDQFILVDIA